MNPIKADPSIPFPGSSWSGWLIRSSWFPRCGGECGVLVGWRGHRDGWSWDLSIPYLFPQGPPGQKGSKGSPVSDTAPLGLHVPAPRPPPPHPPSPLPLFSGLLILCSAPTVAFWESEVL